MNNTIDSNMQEQLQTLLDKQTLTELMYKFARALDRVDAELMQSTYWKMLLKSIKTPFSPNYFSITITLMLLLNQQWKVFEP